MTKIIEDFQFSKKRICHQIIRHNNGENELLDVVSVLQEELSSSEVSTKLQELSTNKKQLVDWHTLGAART